MSEARSTYHHGGLHEALVKAALDMSREHGAAAVVLREATRRAGVTPRAAYRHFADRDALLYAVAQSALGMMAHTIEEQQGQTTATIAATADEFGDAAEARGADDTAQLRSVGLGYIRFALDEPGWFDVAFFAMAHTGAADAPAARGRTGRSPYDLLQDALQALVAAGRLAPERVADATVTCWSGVHGFAALTALGPLRELPRAVKDAQAERLVSDLVEAVVRAE